MGDQFVVHEPRAVHRLHHPTDRFVIYGHPASQTVQAVAIRGRREPVDQLPLIRNQTHLNLFATQIQTNMQHEHSSPGTKTGRIRPAHPVP